MQSPSRSSSHEKFGEKKYAEEDTNINSEKGGKE